jgi:anti-sigma factor RsiW
MNVTHEVITDLLPLYLAGEASADTRALVEEYLRLHPDIAAKARAEAERNAAALASLEVMLPDDHEKRLLERTRRFNRYRAQMLGFTIGFALMPFAFVFGDGIRWVMLRDNPKQAIMFWIAAAGCWFAYHVLGRRLRTDA